MLKISAMKTFALLLFLFPAICFSQTEKKAAVKPSTTDCPTWNSGKPSSKANQFEAMRHKPVKLDAAGNPVKTVKPKKAVNHTPSFNAGSDKVLEKKKIATAETEKK
jgi:hypothetical protein